jgi:hypothetical protein
MKRPPAPPVCPVCGEEVPRNALACPECGADHESGWREDAGSIDATGGDEEFDYEEFVAEEFGTRAKPKGIATVWWVTAVVVLLLLAIGYLRGWR